MTTPASAALTSAALTTTLAVAACCFGFAATEAAAQTAAHADGSLPVTAEARSAALDGRITDAPGEGIIPGISDRNAYSAVMYSLDAQPVQQMSPTTQRRHLHFSNSTFAEWTFEKGAVVGLHHHPNEQISWIVSGRVEVLSNGKRFEVGAGEFIVFPPNVPHEFRALEDTVNIDFFAPARQDWMDGDDRYLPK